MKAEGCLRTLKGIDRWNQHLGFDVVSSFVIRASTFG
jgi:hypothetical protein